MEKKIYECVYKKKKTTADSRPLNSKCGLWTIDIGITWELVRNVEYQTSNQTNLT